MNYFFPNELDSRNLASKPNLVWVSDLFELPILYKSKRHKAAILFVVDISTNELLSVKAFLKSSHGGSIKSKLVCRVFKELIKQREIKNELIIHTDRGAEYTSKEFYNFIKSNKLLIGSMNHTGRPKQNAVAERMVRTLKRQLTKHCGEIESVQSVKEIQQFFDKKKEHYNHKVKPAKNYKHTPIVSHQALVEVQKDEPLRAIAFNRKGDANALEIQQFRKQAFQQFKSKNPFQVLTSLEHHVIQTQVDVKELGEKLEGTLERIEEKVTPKQKVFRKHLPLRDAATNTIYFQLISEPRGRRMRITEYFVFRIAITLLRFTGLRVNEIRTFNKEQFLQLIEEGSIQIYQSKQNKHRTVLLSDAANKALNKLKDEAMYVFCKRDTLAGGASPSSWITFINNKLKGIAKQYRLYIKSHSFRINFITSLLKFAPVQQVSGLIGHQDVKSTMAYNRYTLDQIKAKALIDKAISNVKEEEVVKKEGEERQVKRKPFLIVKSNRKSTIK